MNEDELDLERPIVESRDTIVQQAERPISVERLRTDKPFIKLFRTPNAGYFLDVNKDEILPISDSSFQYLDAFLSDKDNGLDMPEELVNLKSQGYLTTESVVKRVQHSYSQNLETFLQRKLAKITLQVTQNCNFRCKYCIYNGSPATRQRSHSNKRMSWQTARDAVDFLWNHSADSPTVDIGFYGGEPLLEFELMKKIIDYSERKFYGKELTFTITTNGTLLTTEILEFLQDHNFSLVISLDGPKEINDKNRVFADGRGTFDSVMRQIELIKKIAPGYFKKLMISMVIDPMNDFDCINSIHIKGVELNEINLLPAIVDYSYLNRKTTFSDDYEWRFEYQMFLAILAEFKRFPDKDLSLIAKKGVSSIVDRFSSIAKGAALQETDIPSGPCIPGQMRLFIDVLGRFLPCERVSEKSAAMCIGSIKDGFDIGKANRVLNTAELIQAECCRCWCFRYCMQCARMADDENGTLSAATKLEHCEDSRDSAYAYIMSFLIFKELPFFYSSQIRAEQM